MDEKEIPHGKEYNARDLGYIEKAILNYKQSLERVLGSEEYEFIEQYIITLIEKVLNECPNESVIENYIDEIIQNFSECIIDQGIVESTFFKKTDNGFIFEIEGCIFANLTHDKLKKFDVVCPLLSVVKNIIRDKRGPYQESASSYTKTGVTCSLTYNDH